MQSASSHSSSNLLSGTPIPQLICNPVFSPQEIDRIDISRFEMENGLQKWRIKGNMNLSTASDITVRGVFAEIRSNLNPDDDRRVIPIGLGDPSSFACFRTTPAAEDAVVDSLRSASFNGLAPASGILPARRAVAEYLSRDLPYKLSPEDVHLALGCKQAIEVALGVLANPGANILLPRPGFPLYESRAGFCKLEIRHYDLIPEKGWEVDLDVVEALADDNTVAIVVINPGNPCGSVYTREHLRKVAETARKLGMIVIADEVYDHLVFGSDPFVPMGTFGSIAPVLTVGSISKRWIVPGWRLGWLVTTDPNGIFKKYGITDCIKSYISISSDPPTFIQGAIPQLLEKTKDDFFSRIIDLLRRGVDISFAKIEEISCLTSPFKPQGGMFTMVKLDPCMLDGIKDDIDFCKKLANEESVTILPGVAVGMKNWLRVSFAVEPALLEEAFERIKAFCQRHAKKN